MRILITGVCGFVGSTLALGIRNSWPSIEVVGVDNFIRRGSELNYTPLLQAGVDVRRGDVRRESDLSFAKKIDWVIDAAANPTVVAGMDSHASSRELLDHNLVGTIEVLQLCRRESAGLVLLSTSRVYSCKALAGLKMSSRDGMYHPSPEETSATDLGIDESFSTTPPLSLYGVSKLCSEQLAIEYGEAFRFPVWINRCGLMAGAGQFGHPFQGIVSYWINAHLRRSSLAFVGFDGLGYQVRDCLHPMDLLSLVMEQINDPARPVERVQNVSGGPESSFSLRTLTDWCDQRFGEHPIRSEPANRPFDVPWLVLDARRAHKNWNWKPRLSAASIFEEVATHADRHPEWLGVTGA